ncbi:MAG: 3-phosphoshikimate 1-carboxyvinyltransferase, partial [Candidatus Eremiobacterota bacterium]
MVIAVTPCREPWDLELTLPGDKSLSHRALMLAGLADGPSRVTDLSPGRDVRSTLGCLRHMGLGVRGTPDDLTLTGWGAAWREPDRVLDCGNSGT